MIKFESICRALGASDDGIELSKEAQDAIKVLEYALEYNKESLGTCKVCARLNIQSSPNLETARVQLIDSTPPAYPGLSAKTALYFLEGFVASAQDQLPLLSQPNPPKTLLKLFVVVFDWFSCILTAQEACTEWPLLLNLTKSVMQIDLTKQVMTSYQYYLNGQTVLHANAEMEFASIRRPECFPGAKIELKEKPKSVESPKEAETKQVMEFQLTVPESVVDLSAQECVDVVHDIFGQLDIKETSLVFHDAAATIKDLLEALPREVDQNMVLKNLFLRGKNKETGAYEYILVSVPHTTNIDYKALTTHISKTLDIGFKSALRQASEEELFQFLRSKPGHITPLSLVFDSARKVHFFMDSASLPADTSVYIHPLINSATIGLSLRDLGVLVQATGRSTRYLVASTPVPGFATHEEAQKNVLSVLEGLRVSVVKEDLTKEEGFDPKARPKGHSTHNLLVSGKSKKPYLVCMLQETKLDLTLLGKKLGEKGLRLVSQETRKKLFGLEKGCITLAWLVNCTDKTVEVVIQSGVLALPKLRACVGCDDVLDHSQHNMANLEQHQVQKLLECVTFRELDFTDCVK